MAASVVVDLILPPGVPLVSANPGNPAVYHGKFVWNLTNVRTGVNAISLVVAVPTDVPLGTVLRTTAFANYTDGLGNPVGGSQTSTDVTVSLFAPAAGPPFTAIGGGLIVVVIVGLLGSRMYLSHTGQAVIDEVFLLHRDGLLIKRYTRRLNPDVDSDILSGMLIAVQNFVNESFIGEAGPKREGQLDELKFGEYRMLIVRGEHVITAAVVSGRRVERVPAQIRGAIEDVEKELGGVLAKWDGNMDQVAAADRYMQDLIEGRYRSSLKFGRGKR
ncbi:MAG: hypothetical protein AUI36_35980 [Cyanobacteria bacterium 13_1_40CM_2_61_4]|nr:MAG: hypothetical protein AUI36_35980 [Cyanobacteria bacterium 13_1_40CM_2_61_4]